MKKNIRSKISSFLTSEDGRVSAKAPLALSVATGSVLLAQAMIPSPAQAEPVLDESGVTCRDNDDCADGEVCKFWFQVYQPGPTVVVTSECDLP